MKGIPLLMAVLLLSSGLAMARVCMPDREADTRTSQLVLPSTVAVSQPLSVIYPYGTPSMASCPAVPSASACCPVSPVQSASAFCPLPSNYYQLTSAGTPYQPMVFLPSSAVAGASYSLPSGCSTVSALPQGSISSDACTCNQISGLRADVRVANLQMRGQMLIDRMDNLQARELAFRQNLAANPNLPNAQLTAQQLSTDAAALNRDIAAFNQELNSIPLDQRQAAAPQLSTFYVAYWQPATQRFSTYQASFPQSSTTYQSSFAANPWLQQWHSGYQASLNTIGQSNVTIASNPWWASSQPIASTGMMGSSTMVAGTMMSSGNMMMCPSGVASLPSGQVFYVLPQQQAAVPSVPAPSTTIVVIPLSGTTTQTASVPQPIVIQVRPGETQTVVVPSTTTTTTTTTAENPPEGTVAGTTETTTTTTQPRNY